MAHVCPVLYRIFSCVLAQDQVYVLRCTSFPSVHAQDQAYSNTERYLLRAELKLHEG